MEYTWEKYEEKMLGLEAGWRHPSFDKIKKVLEEERDFSNSSVQIQEGEKCRKCAGSKTYTYQKQVRSADEGFTSFTVCFECNFQLVE